MYFVIIFLTFFLLLLTAGAGLTSIGGYQFRLWGRITVILLDILISIGYAYFYHQSRSAFANFFENILMIAYGMLVISFSVIVAFLLLERALSRFQLSIKGIPSLILAITLILAISAFARYNANTTILRTITIPVANLKNPSKILYLSDIHIAKKSDLPFLEKIIKILNQNSADFVVINGDFVDGRGFEKGDFKILDQINKPVIFTYGNHENYIGNDYVYELLKDTKLQFLSDQKTQIGEWEILGLADMSGFDNEENRAKLEKKLEEHPRSNFGPRFLILHEPIGPEIAAKYGANLQVAGHTHNGQLFPFSLLVKLAFPYTYGLYNFPNHSLFVSSGVGTRWPPMRRGSQSEIILLNLIPKK